MTCICFMRCEGTKLMVEKSWLGGSIYMIEEISRIECRLKKGEHRMTLTHSCIN